MTVHGANGVGPKTPMQHTDPAEFTLPGVSR